MDNPLMKKTFEIPFEQIKPEHVVPAIDHLLEDAVKKSEDLAKSRPSMRTFENTLLAFEAITEDLEYAANIAGLLKSVDDNKDIREAYDVINPKITEFTTNLFFNDGLYNVIKEYSTTDEAKNLPGPKKRFLKQTLDAFIYNGAELDDGKKAQLKEINVSLAKLTTEYAKNALDATNAYEKIITDEARLAGLPDRVKEQARQAAEEKGIEGWLFTLHVPSCSPVFQFCDDRELRKELYMAYNTRASGGDLDNGKLMTEIICLRNRRAKLLGFENWADFTTKDRMAKDGKTARNFLEAVKTKVIDHFKKENQELDEFYRGLEGDDAQQMELWDIGYYAEKLRKARFDFDVEKTRPYFSFGDAADGLFGLMETLFGITIKKTEMQKWKGKGIETFKAVDEDGTWMGSFLLDYIPRKEKRGGAWMDCLYAGGPKPDGSFQPHLAYNCGNLTP
ncbi:oligopeptidase A, partial [Candidatus Woesearchaeota archaeon CG08_land_8_20_14_0_20_43_7]